MAIQLSYTSTEIEALLDAAGTAVQGTDLPGLAATLKAADAASITSTSESPADLDTYLTPGNFKCTTAAAAKTVLHGPDGLKMPFRLRVEETTQANPPRVRQTMYVNTELAPGVHVRYYNGTTFGAWHSLACTEDITRAVQAPEMVLISEFEYIAGGWWTAAGGFSGTTTLYHSQLIPIIPGGRHYLGYLYSSSNVVGAFFDGAGNWIASLAGADVTEFPAAASGSSGAYKTPSGSGSTSGYISLYFFDAPANACYFSYNLANSDTYTWKQYISSKPVFMLANSGNFIVRPGDALYQAKKTKKLCIIGPSSVMIDRWDRASQGSDTPYVVGFQEYLAPWYAQVDSYGYSGGAMYPATGETYTSIYNGIVTAQLDLSGYDEFLIQGSSNGLSVEGVVGDWDSTDTSKYFGALNGIIDYIYSMAPTAAVWITDITRKKAYYTYGPITVGNIDAVNAGTKQLAASRSCGLIPAADTSGVNRETYTAYTYDGTHSNSAGNRVYGMCCRKAMLGF